MNVDFSIALPHTILLSFYLIVLIYSIAKDYSFGYYLIAGLICIEAYWTLEFGVGNMFSHILLDLGALAAICSIFFLVKKSALKWILVTLSYIGFIGLHINYENPQSTNSADKISELLVQFDDKTSLTKWIEKHASFYEITYPLFTPADQSFLLDEYLMVSALSVEDLVDFQSKNHSVDGIVHIENNDAVVLETPIHASALVSSRIYSLNDPLVGKQWMADPYKLDEFHKLTDQKKLVSQKAPSIIAILDTGVDAKHEDLKANYQSISKRYDSDTKGHGTHCAGIAAAVTGNKIGIASLTPKNAPVKVTSIKVLNNFGAGTQKTIIDGIIRAADEGCSVISLSLGGITSDSKEKAYTEAVKYANAKGSIVVVAAGNSGRDARSYTPANTPGVIAVTALDSLMNKASFGNDVSHLGMGLAAPGSGIYSTFPNDKYQAFNGTSMAAPFISGLIGLMKAYDPELTTQEVYRFIRESAIEKDNQIIANPYGAMELLFNSRLEG